MKAEIEFENLPEEINIFELSKLVKRALYTEKKFDGKVLEINIIPKK